MPQEPASPALGVDFGERRIGLALSDPARSLAVPLGAIERTSDRAAIGEIAAVARREGAGLLVVGEPRRLDGGRGDAARRARRFGERLARATGLPLVLVDEALTTVEAEARLAEAGVTVKERTGRVDAVAAQILLQEALDRGLGETAGRAAGETASVPTAEASR